jgi:hypothetical protein
MPTDEIVRLYRQRMQIKQCFRDWKSHLGLRGLYLQVEKPQRLLRLLMAFTSAYLLVLLLGQDPLAEKLRPYFEVPRRQPRHGTRKVLSALSMALYLLADPRWGSRLRCGFVQIHSTSPMAVVSLCLPLSHHGSGGGQGGMPVRFVSRVCLM